MTQTTPERKPCSVCGNEYTVTANKTIRHHFTENPDFQAGPDSRKCKGVGQPPAGAAGVALAEDMEAGRSQCRLCKHPAQLTGNGRVRSHLTPEQTPRQCPGGSDFPLGTYPDLIGTTDGLVATLAADCEHVPVGQCYGCHGAAGKPVSDAELDAMAETEGTGAAPWGVDPATVTQRTMADQFKTVETDDFGQPVRTCFNCDAVACPGCDGPANDEARSQAERFMDAAPATHTGRPSMHSGGGGLSAAEQERLAAVVATDYRTGEQKAADARMSRLTDEAIKVLEQRSPEEKAETTARMDRTASAALGVPLDPALNHNYTDPSGVEWIHPGPEETYQAPDCTVLREAGNDVPTMDQYGRIKGGGVYCEKCDTDDHRCPGCGTDVPHGTVACAACTARVDAEDAERLGTCTRCGKPRDGHAHDVGPDPELPNCPHPETHRAGCGCPDDDSAPGQYNPEDDPQTRLGELDEGDYFLRKGTLMRLTERESSSSVLAEVMDGPHKGRTGELTNLNEVVQRAPAPQDATSGPVRVGELEEGDHFTRRGTLMRVTSAGYGLVEAVVVDGPHKGRTGELKNPDELVDREPCRHSYAWGDDGKFGHSGSFCEYCGAGDPATEVTTEQETKECTDDRTLIASPRSSAASATSSTATATPTSPAHGSPQGTKASAPAVSPKSESVTSSAPTAKAAGNGRSAAVTTDQSAAAAAFLGSGRPAAPASNGTQNQADAAAQFLAGGSGSHGEKETKRDRYGRYLIPHPDTGKEKAWTRATTFAKSISDTYALSQWGLRMALLGATMRPDIVARAHGKHVRADKALLDELTAELKNAAGDKVAANLGTAMHSFTEMADRAWHSPGGPRSILDQVPADCRGMVETYIRLLEETGLEPVPHLIEFTTVVKQYGVAGTSDNCYKVTKPLVLKIGRAEVRFQPGEYVIGDKKTGRDLDYGWQEIAIQLGTYAQGINTAGVWDRHDEVWEPDPLSRFDKPGTKVRTDAGIVIHLPVDKESEKTPTVYGVDLESGWNAAVLCERVRAWRNVRTLASPVMVSEAGDTFAPSRAAAVVKAAPMAGDHDPDTGVTTRTTVRPPSLKDKALAVTSKGDASAVWKEAKAAGLPDTKVDELVAVMQNRLKELAEPGG
ncbi:hypothetical protein [Streptomyces sp. NRRL S-455]|uniref:hypothetical protein n=1 Tax=Streptomyces sp. NRRL S-455 TaxID=1463908 RepID=UPI0004C19097|nr:hypothetical protein [Streptomyces sp. NRRL S-455]